MPLDSGFENDDSQPWSQVGRPLRITVRPAPPPNLQQGNGSASNAATNQIEPDGYPNDWFVPEPDGYPDDWYVPGSSGAPPSNTSKRFAPTAANSRPPVLFGAIEPDGYPNDWIQSDGFSDDWFVPQPDGYPDDWYVPGGSSAPPSNASRWSSPTAANTRSLVPFGAIEPDGYPNDWIATDGYPDDWYVPAAPPTNSGMQRAHDLQPDKHNSAIARQFAGPQVSKSPPFRSTDSLVVGSRSAAAPASFEPPRFSALQSPAKPVNWFSKFLDALNPVSPAYAADDEDEIPSELLAALLHGLDPDLAKKLIEQHRFWDEWRKDLFEVSQGRASSRALARHLEVSGVQRPPGYAAHHIAAGADPRGELARSVLKKFGLGINDAVNGVFLPANRATQVIAGETIHSTLHTKEYYDAVNMELENITSRQALINVLRNIALRLQIGDYP